jgi:hypothetical protein
MGGKEVRDSPVFRMIAGKGQAQEEMGKLLQDFARFGLQSGFFCA